MANVQDPMFWRRFSMAVHLDEEQQQTQKQAEISSSHDPSRMPSLQQTQTWLGRERQKKRRRTCICWAFWLCVFALIITVVVVVLCLRANGMLGGAKSGGNIMDSGNGGTSSKGGDGP